ncbi:hypothetical protein HRbin33_00108 [bacterium HR33]|nr:hypothetical protein HRbin33_00108 [bacterium HR33]
MADRPVLCCLPQETFDLIERTLAKEKIRAVHTTERTLLATPREPALAAMIYQPRRDDLHTGLLVVEHWTNLYPNRPLVLCFPGPIGGRADSLSSLNHFSGVLAWMTDAEVSPQGAAEIAAVVARLLAMAPEFLVRALVKLVSPQLTPAVTAFREALLDRLRTGGTSAPTRSTLAAASQFPLWRIQRACRKAGLPPPERLVEWLTLIYVLARADWEEISIARAAAHSEISDKYLRGLRSRLLPGVPRLSARQAGDILVRAIVTFAQEAKLPAERAGEIAERLSYRP